MSETSRKSLLSHSPNHASVNKKIRNATKTTVGGIKFDSKLESYFYGRLNQFGVNFEFQKRFEIQPKFTYKGQNIQNIDIVVDFYLPGHRCIVDTKGFQTADNKIKIKMLKYLFYAMRINMDDPTVYLPSTPKECDALLIKLNIIK